MANPITAIKNWLDPTALESDVIVFVAKVKAGMAVAEADAKAVFNWLDQNAGTVASDIVLVLNVATKLGAGGNPELAALVAGANVAVAALNTYAQARSGGESQNQAAVDGYKAVAKAQELHSLVSQALIAAQYTFAAHPAALAGLADGPVDVQMIHPPIVPRP